VKKSEWFPGVLEQFRESYEFKQCKKADGSIYGIPDSSSCVMGKEYKPQEIKNAEKDLFASVDKMAKSLGDLGEFNKALAEFTRANYILQMDSPDLGKLPLQASSGAAATKIVGRAVKALTGIGVTKIAQSLYQKKRTAPINPVTAKK
jgi:hypothetical protein